MSSSSWATASIALRIMWPHKPQHHVIVRIPSVGPDTLPRQKRPCTHCRSQKLNQYVCHATRTGVLCIWDGHTNHTFWHYLNRQLGVNVENRGKRNTSLVLPVISAVIMTLIFGNWKLTHGPPSHVWFCSLYVRSVTYAYGSTCPTAQH